MRLALLALAGVVLALAGSASAQDIVDIVEQNVTHLGGCVSTSLNGNVGVGLSSEPPFVVVSAPSLNPPTPDCLVLPGL